MKRAPWAFSRHVKEGASFLRADIVGICNLPLCEVSSYKKDTSEPCDLGYKYAISIVVDSAPLIAQTGPSASDTRSCIMDTRNGQGMWKNAPSRIIKPISERRIKMEYEDLLDLLKSRRSIRQVKPDPIPDDYISKIIEAARWAPSAYNTQPWEFVVIKEPAIKDTVTGIIKKNFSGTRTVLDFGEKEDGKKRDLSEIPPDLYLQWANAPVYILMVADPRTRAGLPTLVQYTYQLRDQFYISSLASAFLYMHLAATTLGLAAQWVSQVSIPQIHFLLKKLLGLPEGYEIYDMIAVGYPALKSRGKFLRSTDKLVHEGVCTEADFRTDEEVHDFLKRSKSWIESNAGRKPAEEFMPGKGVTAARQIGHGVKVDQDACSGCELCIETCPMDVYEIKDEVAIPINAGDCLGCESCIIVCDQDAITISDE